MLPKKVNKARKKAVELEARDYKMIANHLYKRAKDKRLRLCITKEEYVRVFKQAHVGNTDTTTKAIMMARLWWPMLFQDSAKFVK